VSFDLNPAFRTEATYTPDNLLTGDFPEMTDTVTVAAGQVGLRGWVLGRTASAATVGAAVATAGNTGNGAVTLNATPFGAAVKEGAYRIVCIEPAANGGVFAVEDPDGSVVGRAVVGTEFTGPVVFTVADGATDFAAGDSFVIPVSGASYSYKLSAAASTDGSAVPLCILLHDTDTTAGAALAPVLISGAVNKRALIFGTGHTAATVEGPLRLRSIFLQNTVKA
jgi:hypothetical protein